MLEALTGTGLATAAGLNAYIPLLVIGLLSRFTDLINLPGPWAWLGNGWVLSILALLLAVEVVADKIPAVDSINDVVQTVVRPTAGGMAFAAGAGSETITVENPGDLFTEKLWVPLVIGFLISLTVHGAKATARPIMNVATVGVAAPVVSTVEDVTSTGLSFIAILIPILIIVCLLLMIWFFYRWRKKRQERKALERGVANHY